MRTRYSKQQKLNYIHEFQGSGVSLKEFSEEKSINYYTFSRWYSEYELYNSKPTNGFVEVKTTSLLKQPVNTNKIIVKKAGMKIEIPCSLEADQMKTVFEALAAL